MQPNATTRRKQPRSKVANTCAQCGTLYMVIPSELERGNRFCSRTCWKAAPRRKPTRGPQNSKPVDQRFWSHVDSSGGPGACWPWLKAALDKGYGVFSVNLTGHWRMVLAHRFALILHQGRAVLDVLTEPLSACHTCDNPPCCNPLHLFWGSAHDNHVDMVVKGRSMSRLSGDQVREIRRIWAEGRTTQTVLATIFQVDQTVISRIVLGKSHRHID